MKIKIFRILNDQNLGFRIEQILKVLCQEFVNTRLHHHLATMELGHFLPHSGLTLPEVSLNGQSGSICLLSRSFWYSRQSTEYSVYMLQTISSVFVYFIQTEGCV